MKRLYESLLDDENITLDGSASIYNEKHRHYVVDDTRSDIEKYIDDNFFLLIMKEVSYQTV